MRDMDTITFKKIWEDERCFEIEIAAHTECVGAKTTCYTDAETLRRHTCCFYVLSELGALNRFGSRLSALLQRGVGQTAALE